MKERLERICAAGIAAGDAADAGVAVNAADGADAAGSEILPEKGCLHGPPKFLPSGIPARGAEQNIVKKRRIRI